MSKNTIGFIIRVFKLEILTKSVFKIFNELFIHICNVQMKCQELFSTVKQRFIRFLVIYKKFPISFYLSANERLSIKKCFFCESQIISKYGFQQNLQWFKCASCHKVFNAGERLINELIGGDYSHGK